MNATFLSVFPFGLGFLRLIARLYLSISEALEKASNVLFNSLCIEVLA